MQNLVSIIMPVYNWELFLEETILSVLNQTYKNRELIIINDNSKDQSEYIIMKYIESPQIRYIKNKKNLNVVLSRNIGLKEAKGEYICFLDQDDLYEKEKIALQVNFLNTNKDFVLVGCWTSIINENNKVTGYMHPRVSDKDIRNHLIISNQFACSAVMFRKSMLIQTGLLNPKFTRCDDYDLRLRAAIVGKIANLPNFLFRYRFHWNNTTLIWNNALGNKYMALQLVWIYWKHFWYARTMLWITLWILTMIIPSKQIEKIVSIYHYFSLKKI